MFKAPSEAAIRSVLANDEKLNELSRAFKEDLAQMQKESERLDKLEIVVKVGTLAIAIGAVVIVGRHYKS